jgi:hypothetical protein
MLALAWRAMDYLKQEMKPATCDPAHRPATAFRLQRTRREKDVAMARGRAASDPDLGLLLNRLVRGDARAESKARSGPHATGCPVRMAEQKRAIPSVVAEARSFPSDAGDRDVDDSGGLRAPWPAPAGFVSDASNAAPPGVAETSTPVAWPPPRSSNSSASTSLYMTSVAFVPKKAS